jgi:hypothetical protein
MNHPPPRLHVSVTFVLAMPTTPHTTEPPPPRTNRARATVLASFACLATALALAACARHTPPHATAMDAERAHVSLEELEQGRSLLVARCGSRCHKTPLPTDKVAAEWPHALDEMAERSNLDAAQRHVIEQYLVTMAPR